MLLTAGTRLGPYEILAPLGAGGMGEVYRARDMRLERTVAIKILPAQFCSDPLHKQRFEREAKTISNLNHPHICVLHDIGRQDGIDYLVMECVEGESLAVIVHNWVPTRLNSLGCNEGVAGRFCSLTRRVPSFILAQDALDVRRKFTEPIGTHTESDLCYDPLITLRE